MKRGWSAFFALLGVLMAPALAQERMVSTDWGPFKFLIGDWVGQGTGQPGEASGGFSFSFELQGRILVRRNYAEYPAAKDHPAFRHDDLMVLYADSPGPAIRAVYFDNEGHTIYYHVALNDDQKTLTFQSDPVAGQPRFQFVYHKVDEQRMTFEFNIAPPNKPDAFAKYVGGEVRKK